MRRMIELAYVGLAIVLIVSPFSSGVKDDERRPSLDEGAAVARAAIDSYSSLLSRVATQAADALDAGELTSDRELLQFLETHRQAAADAAFEPLHQHQQDRIGVRPGDAFDPGSAAELMREYAEGWKR